MNKQTNTFNLMVFLILIIVLVLFVAITILHDLDLLKDKPKQNNTPRYTQTCLSGEKFYIYGNGTAYLNRSGVKA